MCTGVCRCVQEMEGVDPGKIAHVVGVSDFLILPEKELRLQYIVTYQNRALFRRFVNRYGSDNTYLIRTLFRYVRQNNLHSVEWLLCDSHFAYLGLFEIRTRFVEEMSWEMKNLIVKMHSSVIMSRCIK